jgi:pyruvate-ferredoxin/flavodoxin oxidoreductase
VRYKVLAQTRAEEAAVLLHSAQQAIDEKYRLYEDMAGWEHTRFHPATTV